MGVAPCRRGHGGDVSPSVLSPTVATFTAMSIAAPTVFADQETDLVHSVHATGRGSNPTRDRVGRCVARRAVRGRQGAAGRRARSRRARGLPDGVARRPGPAL